MAKKYPISKEFFPLTMFSAPINLRAIKMSQKILGVPKFVWRDPELSVVSHSVPGYQGAEIEVLVIAPKDIERPAPCFIDIHGGGFVFDAAPYQYHLAMEYARQACCVVAFVRYRLAPDFPFPVPQEDSYGAVTWVFAHAEELGIDPDRIGVGGDSAGGSLAVASCLMMRDRGVQAKPLFQLLIYPWLDDRNVSDSYKRYTDVPMWNSSKSKLVGPIINPDPSATPLAYRSIVEAESLAGLPPAYIEVAEFDCLHDDGVYFAQLLREQGIEAELHETRGTIHGFDAKLSAPTTQAMLAERVAYLSRMFG